MAACRTSSSSGRSELQDLIECPICCLRFERPLQLSCGHSFCGNCVDRLVADARGGANRNDFFDAIRGLPLPPPPNVDRGGDPLNFNRLEGEMWMQVPRPLPQYPGLGGIPPPRYAFLRNFNLYDENPMLPPRRAGGIGGDYVIKCPECRQPTRVPPEGLPVNYRLQEVLSRVAETSATKGPADTQAAEHSESDGSRHPKCLSCDDMIVKGVYLSCRTCAPENETVRQLCSMCCLRNHNGHDIEEKRFLTMNDILASRETVSEAAGRGYQAVDQVTNEFSSIIDRAKEILQENSQNVLQAFELVANDLQFELLSCHDELERKVAIAHEICNKLEQWPSTVKQFMEEFLNSFGTLASDFVNTTLIYEGLRGNASNMERSRDMEAEPGRNSTRNGTSEPSGSARDQSYRRDHECRRELPRACHMLGERARQLRTIHQHCSSMRRRNAAARVRLQDHLRREGYAADPWALESDRERREQHREDLRNALFGNDDHTRACVTRRPRAPRPSGTLSPTGSNTPFVPPLPKTAEERQRSESVEILDPPAVLDLEQRAGRLIISPERRRPKIELEAGIDTEGVGDVTENAKIKNKHRRGGEPAGSGETSTGVNSISADSRENLLPPGSPSPRSRPPKRKFGVGASFPSPVNEPGPSFFAITDDVSVDVDVDREHVEVEPTNDAKFEELNFLE